MSVPNRLIEAALEIQEFCERKRWRFCFIGGIAVQHWGEARLTRDADLEIFTGIGDEALHIDALLAGFAPRVDKAREFALRHRVLLLHASNGVPLDISLGALAFEEHAVTNQLLRRSFPTSACGSPRRRRCWYSRLSPIALATGWMSKG